MKKTIALLIFPGAQSLDITGPMDVFSEANRFLLPENQYQLEVIGVEPGLLPCSNGLLIQAHRHFSEVDDAYDLLLVVGGPDLGQQEMHQDVYDWLRLSSQRARRFGSIAVRRPWWLRRAARGPQRRRR